MGLSGGANFEFSKGWGEISVDDMRIFYICNNKSTVTIVCQEWRKIKK